jgi:RNA polymerase sigma-70 factor (ECF subfamily)
LIRVGSAPAVQGDSELVELVLAGQLEAFGLLVGRYQRLVRAAALRIVRDSHLAEDVAQEAFVAAFESLSSLRGPARFGPWVLGIARRQAARAARRRGRAQAVAAAVSAPCERNGLPSPASMQLLEFIERLPEHERVLVGLRHFEGCSVAEMAAITERPIGTITKQLSRAHERLRKWLSVEEFA